LFQSRNEREAVRERERGKGLYFSSGDLIKKAGAGKKPFGSTFLGWGGGGGLGVGGKTNLSSFNSKWPACYIRLVREYQDTLAEMVGRKGRGGKTKTHKGGNPSSLSANPRGKGGDAHYF